MAYILSSKQEITAATAMSVGVTHSPQTLNKHTSMSVLQAIMILYLQPMEKCVPAPVVDEDQRLKDFCRKLLGRGHQKKCGAER